MTAQNKIIPVLRFKEFDGGWNKRTLFDISENVSYGMNAAATEFDGIHKYIRITDIDVDSGAFKPNPLTSPEGIIDEKFRLKINDIVFARTGASVGKSYLYNPNDGELYYAGFLIKFSITNADSYFIYSLTLKEAYNKWVHIYSMRSGQPGLNAEEYKALKLNIPTLPEQQKIASFFSAIDEKIQQLTRKKEFLEQYKKGVMQQLFSGKLRFKDENGKAYPKWESKKIGDVVSSKSAKYNPGVEKKSYKCIELEHLSSNTSLLLGYADSIVSSSTKNKFQKGDVLFGKLRPYLRKFLFAPFEGVCSSEIWVLRGEGVSNEFLFRLVQTEHFIDLTNQSTGSKMPRADWNVVSAGIVNIPSKLEQQKIASYLSAIDTKIESISTQITQTKTFKKGLLQQMFV